MLPFIRGQKLFEHPGDLGITFEQLHGHPLGGILSRHIDPNQRFDLVNGAAYIGADLWTLRLAMLGLAHQIDGHLEQLAHALGTGGGNRHHGDVQSFFQPLGIHQHSFLLGYIHHVQGHHHRGWQADQFRDKIQAAFQVGCADHGDHHIGFFTQNILTGNHLFRRVGRQAVGAG
ncbi:hypothetical protein SDC9_200623 [bioreactor metagenome]|uniref:Uncharacterized protein n=1 Tax=bioreactor metagenome TaxID=1076179 RepID=A0A645IPC7_9ZZZZ